MQKNYMMNANDVADELGVSKGHAYKLIRQLNEELAASGYLTVSGKIPRAFWEKKFYGQTARQITGKSLATAWRYIQILIKADVLESDGNTNNAEYILKKSVKE